MFLPIETSSGVPIYRQIMDQVRRMIATGTLRPGDRVPSTRDLAATLGINHLTVAKAFGELERTGVIVARRGIGMFVADDPPAGDALDAARQAADRLALEAAQAGLTPAEAAKLLEEAWGKMPWTRTPSGSKG